MSSKIKDLSCFIIIHFLIGTLSRAASVCTPSSCGKISNISHPFRLTTDPKHCGNHDYELVCENNTASLFFLSHKYTVQAINYSNYTIRLTDASINSNDNCSFPSHSLSRSDFPDHEYPYGTQIYRHSMSESRRDITRSITFMSCRYPVNNSLLLDVSTACVDRNYGFNERHRYVKFGMLNGSYVKEMCTIEMMAMTSLRLNEEESVTLSEIHRSLVYGFELSWFIALCERHCVDCWLDGIQTKCEYSCSIGFWQIPCGGMPFWFSVAVSGTTWIIQLAIEYGIKLNLALRIIFGIPCVAIFLIYKLRRRHFSAFNIIEGFLQNNNNLVPIRYSFSDIKKMTRNFKDELGKGGYGSVYKGKLRSGHEVAVKMLSKTKDNGQDFINEVATIGRIHHVNIVKLVGYCVEGSKHALVYDLMPNGSLEKYIFDHQRRNSLSWQRKHEIAIGVARGIEYLHKGCDVQILHFDIKPHNILLDENFTPKISDFGLAKFFSVEKNVVTLTAARGTIGYVAPELITRSIGEVSYKADVYSFGMLLMEMIGLNKDKTPNDKNSSQHFPYWIYDHINKGEEFETEKIDDDDGDGEYERKIKKMAIVGLWCIHMNPIDRPSMSEVLKMLEDGNDNLQIPLRLCESSQNEYDNDEIWETETTDSIALLML